MRLHPISALAILADGYQQLASALSFFHPSQTFVQAI
jgi:hypothetical protein